MKIFPTIAISTFFLALSSLGFSGGALRTKSSTRSKVPVATPRNQAHTQTYMKPALPVVKAHKGGVVAGRDGQSPVAKYNGRKLPAEAKEIEGEWSARNALAAESAFQPDQIGMSVKVGMMNNVTTTKTDPANAEEQALLRDYTTMFNSLVTETIQAATTASKIEEANRNLAGMLEVVQKQGEIIASARGEISIRESLTEALHDLEKYEVAEKCKLRGGRLFN